MDHCNVVVFCKTLLIEQIEFIIQTVLNSKPFAHIFHPSKQELYSKCLPETLSAENLLTLFSS